jgi:hypothetical protein
VIDPDDEALDQPRSSRSSVEVVTVANAVFAGVATVFTVTRSVVVTVLAGGLVALLGLLNALSRRRHR